MIKIIQQRDPGESEWVSISDLMSVLMMIFLFVAISYMHNVQQSQLQVKKIAVAYQELQTDLYQELWKEFEKDLPKWKAVIDKETLTIRFEEPDVLFRAGSADLAKEFKVILDDFFPRYIKILSSNKYRDNIEEIRIEGHTSSEWSDGAHGVEAYFKNMGLSQDRTRSVLNYCATLISDNEVLDWSLKHLSANGLSSSKKIVNHDGIEDKEKSRRVEFRTKTNAEKKVVEIIDRMKSI